MQPQEYKLFSRFLDRLSDYLYENGWYSNGYYIRRDCHSFVEVEKYLTKHCFNKKVSAELVKKLKTESELIEQTYE